MKTRIRRLDPILIQAVIAAALSFAHLHDIADAAGQGSWKGWAYPVSVDLLMVMAWKRIRSDAQQSKIGAWFWFLLSLGASLSANIATAGVVDLENTPTWLRVLVAGWPVMAFLGGSLLVHSRTPAEDVATEVESREAPPERAPAAVYEPLTAVPDEAPTEVAPKPPAPVLVSYADAAEALGLAVATVRGWANNGTVAKHAGPTPTTARVNLVECKLVQSRRVAVGG